MRRKAIPVYDIEDFRHLGTETDFYINTVQEHLMQHNPHILLPHGHTFYASIMATRGSGVHTVDFHDYKVKPGSVFLLVPGQVHSWVFSDDIAGYVLFHKKQFFNMNFTHEKVENFAFFGSPPPVLLTLKPEQIPLTEVMFQRMLEEYRGGALMRFQVIVSLLNILYIELSRWCHPPVPNGNNNHTMLTHLRRLEQLIEQHYKEIKSPAKYAELMYMSEKNLNRVVKTSLNKTVSEVIFDKLILEAKRMLIYSHLSVAEIALQLGYSDTPYFNRMFKRATNKTPLEFQKNYRRGHITPKE